MTILQNALTALDAFGIPREDTALLLPLGMTTRIVCKHNARNLMDMSHQRMCSRAYHEYRKLFDDVCKVFGLIAKEQHRQDTTIELIASENFVSENIMRAVGSCLTNKYSEGYPATHRSGSRGRYYGGCQYVDELEEYCCEMWQKVFQTNYHVNVQPHSGTNANIAAYLSVLKPGDTILSMSLDNGGHLSHGSPVNISGKIFNFIHYGANKSGWIDTNDFIDKLYKFNPKLVVIGASAYGRTLYFDTFRNVIDCYKKQTGNECYMLVDMAHIAGLVAAGDHPSPFGLADIITTTTHKTLRGTRGGLIFCKPELAKRIDSAVFPCCQGGALQHMLHVLS